MMYVPMQTEIVDCPTQMGGMSTDGSIFIPPWTSDQLLSQTSDSMSSMLLILC